jgi:hypothetical protein
MVPLGEPAGPSCRCRAAGAELHRVQVTAPRPRPLNMLTRTLHINNAWMRTHNINGTACFPPFSSQAAPVHVLLAPAHVVQATPLHPGVPAAVSARPVLLFTFQNEPFHNAEFEAAAVRVLPGGLTCFEAPQPTFAAAGSSNMFVVKSLTAIW